MFKIADTSKTIFCGLMLTGFSAAMVTIPLLPEVLTSVEQKHPHLAGVELNNVLSGYFNSCIGVGEVLGPISAGVLVDRLGFRASNDLTGSIVLGFTVLFFAFNGNFSLLSPFNRSKEDCTYTISTPGPPAPLTRQIS